MLQSFINFIQLDRIYRRVPLKRYPALVLICLGLFMAMFFMPIKKSYASCACASNVAQAAAEASSSITEEFIAHKEWLVTPFYLQIIRPALARMTEQLTATAMVQTSIIGTFFDAKHQLETQLVLDEYHVEAIKDYQPSTALCRLGTATAGLASSNHKSSLNHRLFMKRTIDRQFGAKGMAAASSIQDLEERVEQFANVYCHPQDNRGFLVGSDDAFCGADGGDPQRYNKDINYTRTLDIPLTLDIDLTDTQKTADEEDVIALGNNLFGYDLLSRPSIQRLKDYGEEYHAARSAVAKRSIAENSYYAIVSEKAAGSGASADYLKEMVSLLGYSETADGSGLSDIEKLIGKNPSYNAQMEILTKKIYQDPGFVVSLVDKPANVERQKAAMQSFRLMQQRDFYNSLVRQELVLSVILEELLYERFNKLSDQLKK